jgi:hypothetical protein
MLHLDVREGGPDMLEDVDAEVVVLSGVEGQVEQQEILEVRFSTLPLHMTDMIPLLLCPVLP